MKTKFLLLSLIILLGVANSFAAKKSRLLMVVPPELYHDTEFSDPMKALDSAGIKVVIASTKLGTIKGVLGDSIVSTMLLSDVKVKKFDAICIMGGKGTGQYLWDNEQVASLIRTFQAKNKLVTGICAGSVSLAKAGVLKGKTATTFPVKGFINQLEKEGAKYSDNPVVVDGNIITGNGPVGARNFGTIIVSQLKNQ